MRITLLAGQLLLTPPLGTTEIPGAVTHEDLSLVTGALQVATTTASTRVGPTIAIQCGPDGATWYAMTTPVAASVGSLTTPKRGTLVDYEAIPPQCRVEDAWIRAVTANGNGIGTLTVANIAVKVR